VTPLHAVVLGLVQGATEFLPVSSSGHLILVPALLGWPDPGHAFDAAVHLGTTVALLVYFATELRRLARGALAGSAPDRRLLLALLAGSAPAGLAGLALEGPITAHLHSTRVVAVSLIVWALVLWWADRRAARARVGDVRDVGVPRAVAIGCAQAIALVPGTSRSGITLAAGLVLGLDRSAAARFAFLLGLPLTGAAGLAKTLGLLRGGLAGAELLSLGLAIGTSFVAGLLAVWFLVAYLRRRTLAVFVVYRIALGLVLLALPAVGA
jgi:undecaprenyl-diphosphatase